MAAGAGEPDPCKSKKPGYNTRCGNHSDSAGM